MPEKAARKVSRKSRRPKKKKTTGQLIKELFGTLFKIAYLKVRKLFESKVPAAAELRKKRKKREKDKKEAEREDGPKGEKHTKKELFILLGAWIEEWLEKKGVPVKKIKLKIKIFWGRFTLTSKIAAFLILMLIIHVVVQWIQGDQVVIASYGFAEIASEWCDPASPHIVKSKIMGRLDGKYVIWSGNIMDVKDKGDRFDLKLKLCRQELNPDITVKFKEEEYYKIEWFHAGDLLKFKGRIVGWDPARKIRVDRAQVMQVVPRDIKDNRLSSEVITSRQP